jgi:sugar O-acyltransferase (sialic acid O-acetyltransferase NeuD family)
MNKLALIGASGHGKVMAEIAISCGWKEIVFFDDAWPVVSVNGAWDVVGNTADFLDRAAEFDGVFVSIGNNSIRKSKYLEIQKCGLKKVSLVSPHSVLSKFITIGSGVAIMPGAVVNCDSDVGDGVIVNTACSIDHDCTIGNYSHVSPGAHLAGNVTTGECVWAGLGCVIKEGVTIADRTIIGAGTVVLKNTQPGTTLVGNPAQSIDS